MPYFAGPKTVNRPHAITADAEIPPGGAESVLLGQGSGMGGWSFYVQGGKLYCVHNYVRLAQYKVSSPDSLPAWRHQLRFEFEPTGKAEMRMAMARQ